MFESAIEADELVARIKDYEDFIQSAEAERDAFISHYQAKIDVAKTICDDKTKDARTEILLLTEQLKHFAEANLVGKSRSVKLPSGTLSFRKQPTRFFFDDLTSADAKSERLIDFVKHNAHQFLKVKVDESVDWEHFRRKLGFDESGQDVYFTDTGEIIDGLHAQILPDKFTVKTS